MFSYSFMQYALIISVMISIICPCIGIFLVLKRYSMIGDTLAHASLAGVAVGLLSGINPIVGAFAFTSFCGLLIEFLRKYFKKYNDLILTIVLSLSVGIAISLISSGKLQANVNSFMFGSILTVSQSDVIAVLIIGILSVLTLVLLYNQLVIIAFDEDAAKIAGVRVKLINYIFAILVSAAISVSIKIVGMLVLSSMIALPVATALQLEKGFKITLLSSIAFSIVDILLGLILSYYLNVAPGGFTALISVVVLMLVILIKRATGRVRQKRLKNQVDLEV